MTDDEKAIYEMVCLDNDGRKYVRKLPWSSEFISDPSGEMLSFENYADAFAKAAEIWNAARPSWFPCPVGRSR